MVATKVDKAVKNVQSYTFMMERAVNLLNDGEKLEAALIYSKAEGIAQAGGNMDASGQYSMWSTKANNARHEVALLTDFGPGARFTHGDSIFRPMVEKIEFGVEKIKSYPNQLEVIENCVLVMTLCEVIIDLVGLKGTEWFQDVHARTDRAMTHAKILLNPPVGFLGFCIYKGCNNPVHESMSHVTLPGTVQRDADDVEEGATIIPDRYIHMDCVGAAASDSNFMHR